MKFFLKLINDSLKNRTSLYKKSFPPTILAHIKTEFLFETIERKFSFR